MKPLRSCQIILKLTNKCEGSLSHSEAAARRLSGEQTSIFWPIIQNIAAKYNCLPSTHAFWEAVFLALRQVISSSIDAWTLDEVFCWTKLLSTPPPRVLCRCTSCRGDVVTMAAKPRERRREERDGEKESKKTNPEPNPVPEEERRKTTTEGKGRGEEEGERTRGTDKRRNADVCFHVAWPSNLLSSPCGYWSLCLWIYYAGAPEAPHQSHSSCLICQFKWRLRPVVMLRQLTALWKCRSSFATSWPPHLDNFLYKITSPSHSWIKLGVHASLSLIGLFAGTLLNVNFAKGVCLCRWF